MSAPPPGWAETVAHARAAEGPGIVMVPRSLFLALADHVEDLAAQNRGWAIHAAWLRERVSIYSSLMFSALALLIITSAVVYAITSHTCLSLKGMTP